jgi:formylmethanofuran dehydrogenase subunit B
MSNAWIGGRAVALDEALAAAAGLVANSQQLLVAGLGVDVEAARAAVLLAEAVGGVVDHMHSAAILRDLDSIRESGALSTTPLEVRVRAEVVLLVGGNLDRTWPELEAMLATPAKPEDELVEREIFWLCPGRKIAFDRLTIRPIGRDAAHLAELLAILRARINKRPVATRGLIARQIDGLADRLRSTRFGVAIWSAEAMDAMALEMLNGIVRDLNRVRRFSSLPLSVGDNGAGVLMTCGWVFGYPMRSGFGRGHVEHDPWRYTASRMVASGETDCILWLSGYRPLAPAWAANLPLIALTAAATPFVRPPAVHIAIGCPGIDHDGVGYSLATGTLQLYRASHPSGIVSAAVALTQLRQSVAELQRNVC